MQTSGMGPSGAKRRQSGRREEGMKGAGLVAIRFGNLGVTTRESDAMLGEEVDGRSHSIFLIIGERKVA